MGVKVTNNGFGTLSAGINSTATTVTVDSGQGGRFPALSSGDFFFATLIDTSNNLEIIKVTARSTDSMTVLRAQDNSSARAFSIGDRIELRPTAALFENAHLDNTPTSTGSFGLPKGTTAQQPTASATEGHIRYDTDDNVVYYSNGTNWLKINALQVSLSSVSGSILAGSASTLTLAGTNFGSGNLVVSFTPAGGSASNVTVTPSSQTAATVTVPAAIYGQSASTVIGVKVTNSDGTTSSTVNSTVVAAPSGGTVSNAGGFRIHTFNSSGTFVNTIGSLSVEYIVIAGGGGGGGDLAGGGGAGGYRSSVSGESSGGGASAESTLTLSAQSYAITVGAGGAGGVDGATRNTEATRGNDGSASSIASLVTTVGGGGGGVYGATNSSMKNGRAGGSGGGAGSPDSSAFNGGAGTSGQGFAGGNSSFGNPYSSGGGGGAGSVGANAPSGTAGGAGGSGVSSSITGSSTARAGGGGGSAYGNGSNASGGGAGQAGGGNGGYNNSSTTGPGENADAYSGSGGGGGSWQNYPVAGGNGGSGVVIVRYQL